MSVDVAGAQKKTGLGSAIPMGPDAYITPPIIGGGGGGGGGGAYIAGAGGYIGGATGTPIGGGYIAGGTIGAAMGYAGYTGATGATGTTGGTAPLMIAAAASVRRIVWSCEKKKNAIQSFTHTKTIAKRKKNAHTKKQTNKTLFCVFVTGRVATITNTILTPFALHVTCASKERVWVCKKKSVLFWTLFKTASFFFFILWVTDFFPSPFFSLSAEWAEMESRVVYTRLSPSSGNALCGLLSVNGFNILLDAGWDVPFRPGDLAHLEAVARTVDVVLLTQPTLRSCGALPYLFAHCGMAATVYAFSGLLPFARAALNEAHDSLFAHWKLLQTERDLAHFAELVADESNTDADPDAPPPTLAEKIEKLPPVCASFFLLHSPSILVVCMLTNPASNLPPNASFLAATRVL